jgi:hypothetical protein
MGGQDRLQGPWNITGYGEDMYRNDVCMRLDQATIVGKVMAWPALSSKGRDWQLYNNIESKFWH